MDLKSHICWSILLVIYYCYRVARGARGHAQATAGSLKLVRAPYLCSPVFFLLEILVMYRGKRVIRRRLFFSFPFVCCLMFPFQFLSFLFTFIALFHTLCRAAREQSEVYGEQGIRMIFVNVPIYFETCFHLFPSYLETTAPAADPNCLGIRVL